MTSSESDQQPASSLSADSIHRGEDLLIWRRKHPLGDSSGSGPFCFSSLFSAGPMLISSTSDPYLLWAALKLTGEVAWSRPLPKIGGVATDETSVYAVTDSRLVCVDASTGVTRWETSSWRTDTGVNLDLDVMRRPTLSDGRIFWLSVGGLVTCAHAPSGVVVWRSRRPQRILSPVLVVDGKVIGTEHPSAIFALDAADGRPLWTRNLPNRSLRRPLPAFGGILVRLSDQLLLLMRMTVALSRAGTGPISCVGHVAGGRGRRLCR